MFLAGTILVVLFTAHQLDTERETALTHWKSRLATITVDRTRLVSSWLAARRADAEVLAAFPAVRAQLAGQTRDDEALARHLSRVAAAYGYVGIVVADANGHTAARSASDPGLAAGLLEHAAEQAAQVARSRKPRFELAGVGAGRLLVVTVPVFSDGAPAGLDGDTRPLLGVVTLGARPEAGLYPLLADDADPTHTSETLLIDLESEPPAFLSPLRHPLPADAETPKRSLAALAGLARAGAQGHEAVGEMVDYRGVPVLAAVRRVPPTGWSLALEVNRDEALAEFQRSRRLAGAAAAFLLLALAGFLIALHREQQRARLLLQQMRQERAILNLKSYAEKIVASVPVRPPRAGGRPAHPVRQPRLPRVVLAPQSSDVIGRASTRWSTPTASCAASAKCSQPASRSTTSSSTCTWTARREAEPVRITITGIRIADDEDARLLLIIQDLTEEERLQAPHGAPPTSASATSCRASTPSCGRPTRVTLRFSFVSQRRGGLLGYPHRALAARARLLRPPHPPGGPRARAWQQCRAAIATGTDHEFEYRAVAADGRVLWLRDIVHVLRDAGRAPTPAARPHRGPHRAEARGGGAARERGAAPAGAEDGGGRPARGRHRPRLQQPAHGHPAATATSCCAASIARGPSAAPQRGGHPRRGRAGGRPHAPAPRLQPQAGAGPARSLDLNGIVAGMQAMLQRLLGETITARHRDRAATWATSRRIPARSSR